MTYLKLSGSTALYIFMVSKGQGFNFIFKKEQEPVSRSINFKHKYKLFLTLTRNVFSIRLYNKHKYN